MDECPNDQNNGYGSHNTTHPLTCYRVGCDCLGTMRQQLEELSMQLVVYAKHDGHVGGLLALHNDSLNGARTGA